MASLSVQEMNVKIDKLIEATSDPEFHNFVEKCRLYEKLKALEGR